MKITSSVMFTASGYFIHLPFVVLEESVPSAGSEGTEGAVVAATDSIFDLMLSAGPVVKSVLVILAVMSVVSWGIVLSKWLQVSRAKRQSAKFSKIFWASRNLSQIQDASEKLKNSPVAAVFSAGYRELSQTVRSRDVKADLGDFGEMEMIDRALKRAKAEELTRLEYGTNFLATTASAAPFIGLFGTVWGIMNAFLGLSHLKSSSIQAVAPGISEALVATAIGLAAAIPAVIAFNYFMQQTRILARSMDVFSAEFLNIARRHFLS